VERSAPFLATIVLELEFGRALFAKVGCDFACTRRFRLFGTRSNVPAPSASSGQALAQNARTGHPYFLNGQEGITG
jgi:hypothetical protein